MGQKRTKYFEESDIQNFRLLRVLHCHTGVVSDVALSFISLLPQVLFSKQYLVYSYITIYVNFTQTYFS